MALNIKNKKNRYFHNTSITLHYFRFKDPGTSTWQEINQKCSGDCPNFPCLVDLILSIPASSADAERGFNRLKMVKSDWRSKLSDVHLSEQMTIMLEGPSILQFDPMPAINLWSLTPRREMLSLMK